MKAIKGSIRNPKQREAIMLSFNEFPFILGDIQSSVNKRKHTHKNSIPWTSTERGKIHCKCYESPSIRRLKYEF